MRRPLKLTLVLATLALSATLVLPAGRARAATSGFHISHATLTAPGGAPVATASSLCTPSFNYLIVGVSTALPAGGTVYLQPTTGGPKQVAAQSSGSVSYIVGYPAVCPPAGGLLTLVNNATQQQVAQGTLSPYTAL
ncbi:MAG TPA: hypothetical protein VFE42_23665 [Chloroflexota bacterium]|nr:hypothetical protein [Chloroflexota bacterium]